MELSELAKEYSSLPILKDLLSKLAHPVPNRIHVKGVVGSSKSIFLSALQKKRKGMLVVVGNDNEDAGYLYNDLVQINGDNQVLFFPSSYKRAVKYGQFDASMGILRTEVLSKTTSQTKEVDNYIIVTSPEALVEKVVDKRNFALNTLHLSSGEKGSVPFLEETLASYNFERVDYVYEPGQYAMRGGIVDVFSYSNEYPYRIAFADDEVESIRTFDIETQLSRENTQSIIIIPNLNDGEEEGIPFYEYLQENTLWAFNDYRECCKEVERIIEEGLSSHAVDSMECDEKVIQKLIPIKAFAQEVAKFSRIEFAPLLSSEGEKKEKDGEVFSYTFTTSIQPLFHKNFDLVSQTLRGYVKENYRIYILSDSEKQISRLKTIFEDRKENIPFTPILKVLHEGFVDATLKICCFTDHQIFDRFHKYNLKSEKIRGGKLALTLKELQQFEVGDYVVHYDHGIGRYGGLVRTEINGRMQEMIKLTYLNDDQIFVSLHSLHKLSKYRSKENVPPRINKLGTGNWQRIKEKTKNKVKEVARDLILLYAKRREEKGFAFSKDTSLQEELEASFIYEDTPDQLTITADVKHDMESPRPMDRLICGDVGFGKTEIAIRAAFKAVTDGKQVAVLVPTTVLAFQHYKSFSERLKDFPCTIDYISRARKHNDLTTILKKLPEGEPNIVVGTHRLVSNDVKFKDLGLLIIDEEQKFGVQIKEKLRKLKTNVDTLTMTATPIPRTLQFSLMGSRDMSALQTPPPNRHPIQTELLVYDEEVLREAINFELSRNGQVYVIENHISSIYDMENTIHRLVPDARVTTGHGQMEPERLEKVIMDFSNHEYDVLVATTIIENGIDISNANTIIVCNAQNFGLSELHQLRGRVGRSNKKAFCYLFAPPLSTLPSDAKRRLQAIENFSDLGSGIHIAMQDLDIRGAGNLLGAEQSGFIADMGYDAYQKILQEAVLELKNEEFADLYKKIETEEKERTGKKIVTDFVSDCTIDSDLELRFPAEYIPNDAERIGLYQELDNMETEEQLTAFREKLRDRFGEIPKVSEELIQVVILRKLAKQLGFERIVLKTGKMVLFFVGVENKAYYASSTFEKILHYVTSHPQACSFSERNGKRSLAITPVMYVKTAVNVLNDIIKGEKKEGKTKG